MDGHEVRPVQLKEIVNSHQAVRTVGGPRSDKEPKEKILCSLVLPSLQFESFNFRNP